MTDDITEDVRERLEDDEDDAEETQDSDPLLTHG